MNENKLKMDISLNAIETQISNFEHHVRKHFDTITDPLKADQFSHAMFIFHQDMKAAVESGQYLMELIHE